MVMVWCSGSALVSINEVNLRRSRLVLVWVTVSGFIPGAEYLSRHVTIYPGQLSLAIPSWVGDGAMSNQLKRVDALRLGSKGRYGLYVISLLHTGHI